MSAPVATRLYMNQPSVSIADPVTAPTLSVAGTGATLSAGLYYVFYTWVNKNGETARSPESSITVTLGQTLTVTVPVLPSGVTSANVYIGIVTGSGTLQGSTATTTFTKANALLSGVVPPTKTTIMNVYTNNTTGKTNVKSILVCNPTASAVSYSVNIVPAGQTTAYPQISSRPVNANSTDIVELYELLLNPGDYLQVIQTTVNAMTATICGGEGF